jgi:hypothetical protein
VTAERAAGACYELTVAGQLGPVLRAVLAPAVAATSCAHLTIAGPAERDTDLLGVLQVLGACGLDATTVTVVPVDR